MTGPGTSTTSSGRSRRSFLASVAGNTMEWFEWNCYAVLAPFISAVMFDKKDQAAALLATLGVFAVGFLMRPVGGMVFGHMADKLGRKNVMMSTMLMMSACAFAIGSLPGYASIGLAAPLLLLMLRMLQGLAHGGEATAATTYVAEIAPENRRGLWCSALFAGVFAGSVAAFALAGVLTSTLSSDQMHSWGWRVPFLLGGVLAIVLLIIRRGMHESHDYNEEAAKRVEEQAAPPARKHPGGLGFWMSVLRIAGLSSGITVVHYTWTSYVSTYAISTVGLDASSVYWVMVAAQGVVLGLVFVWGHLSDRVGRTRMLLFFAAGAAALQIPLITLAGQSILAFAASSLVGLAFVGMGGAVLTVTMAEEFPVRLRARGIGISYTTAVAVFGGTAPYINQLFVNWDATWVANVYIILLCAVTAVSAASIAKARRRERSPEPRDALLGHGLT